MRVSKALLRIGIDARFYMESGVGRYLRNLIDNLKVLDKQNEYIIFLLQKDYEKFETTNNFKKVLADFPWYGFAEQFKFPSLLKKYNFDLVHFPHFNVPIFYNGKFIVTIHDLIHQHHSMNRATTLNPITYKFKQFGYRKVFRTAILNSSKILTPSNFVKQDLVNEWHINEDKITVTYEAVDSKLVTAASKLSQKQISATLDKFNIKHPFLFYIGNAHPHKNIEGLIDSFIQLRQNHQKFQLVLSGADHYFWQRIKQSLAASPLKKDIIFTGFITDEQLAALYKEAQVFVLPSFEEGFGIPILEAMALGCPVVASSVASIPEVGGDACIYFDPKDTNDLKEKISQVLNNNALRNNLKEQGRKRVKLFSWKKLAQQTLDIYNQCISE